MTNEEIEQAAARVHLADIDDEINALEKRLANRQEARRELINRYNLNKPAQDAQASRVPSIEPRESRFFFDGDRRNSEFYEDAE